MSTTTIKLPTDHDYLASLPDGTRDELVLRADGVAVLTERVGYVALTSSSATSVIAVSPSNPLYGYSVLIPGGNVYSLSNSKSDKFLCRNFSEINRESAYNGSSGEGVSAMSATSGSGTSNTLWFLSTMASITDFKAWLNANTVTLYYQLATPTTLYSADNGTTWSTTDPAAGTSAIPLHKGTNNVWCTDRLSPEVGLDYVQDTNKVINELRAAIVASGATS